MLKKVVRHGNIVAFEEWWLAILTEKNPNKFLCLSKGCWSQNDWTEVLANRPTWYEYHPDYKYSFIPPELL